MIHTETAFVIREHNGAAFTQQTFQIGHQAKNAVAGFCPQPSDPQLLADYRSLKGIKNVTD
jgi:hypothetical protein